MCIDIHRDILGEQNPNRSVMGLGLLVFNEIGELGDCAMFADGASSTSAIYREIWIL